MSTSKPCPCLPNVQARRKVLLFVASPAFKELNANYAGLTKFHRLIEAGRIDEAAKKYQEQIVTIDKADAPAQVKLAPAQLLQPLQGNEEDHRGARKRDHQRETHAKVGLERGVDHPPRQHRGQARP
jgi:hypothetical protein